MLYKHRSQLCGSTVKDATGRVLTRWCVYCPLRPTHGTTAKNPSWRFLKHAHCRALGEWTFKVYGRQTKTSVEDVAAGVVLMDCGSTNTRSYPTDSRSAALPVGFLPHNTFLGFTLIAMSNDFTVQTTHSLRWYSLLRHIYSTPDPVPPTSVSAKYFLPVWESCWLAAGVRSSIIHSRHC